MEVPHVAHGTSGARRARPWQRREQNLAVPARCASTLKVVPHWAQHIVTGGRLGRRVVVLTERTVRPCRPDAGSCASRRVVCAR